MIEIFIVCMPYAYILDYSKKKHKYQVLSDDLYEKNVKNIYSSGKAAVINPVLYF